MSQDLRTVWKYEVQVGEDVTIGWPTGARVTHAVATDVDTVTFWAVLRPSLAPADTQATFRLVGSGHPIPEGWEIDATAPVWGAPLVWHLARSQRRQ